MERTSDIAIEIINNLHTERLDYNSEYIPLINCANQCAAYEDTRLEPEEIPTGIELANVFAALQKLKQYEAIGTVEQIGKLAPVAHGEWKQSVLTNDFFRCSICSAVWPRKFSYCPNCGAKMDLEVSQNG